MKRSKTLKIILSTAILVVLLIVVGLMPINLWFAKNTIERFAQEKLNVDLALHGPVRLRLGPYARVDAMLIEVSKAGNDDEAILRVAAVSARLDLLGLLRGDVHLEEFLITGAGVDYCAESPSFESPGNDSQSSSTSDTSNSIAVDSITISDLQIYCGDQQGEQSLDIFIDEVRASAPVHEAIEMHASARVNLAPFQITAEGGNLNALLADIDEFPFHLDISAESADFALTGEINRAFDNLELRVESDLHLQDPQRLLANMGLDLPFVLDIDVAFQGRLSEEAIELDHFEAQVGKNDIRGTGAARLSSGRKYFEIDAQVGQLDLTSFEQASGPTEETDDSQSLDLQAIFSELRGFDGQARVTADSVSYGSTLLDGIELDRRISLFLASGFRRKWRCRNLCNGSEKRRAAEKGQALPAGLSRVD